MANPITQHRTHSMIYLLSWVVIGTLQALFVHWAQEVSWNVAVIEATIYTMVFSFFGLVIWYVVRFSGTPTDIWNTITTHLVSAALLVGAWLAISYSLTQLLIRQPIDLSSLTLANMSWRIGLGVIYYLIVTLNYYLLIFYQNYQEKQVAELEMQALLKESELSMLKAQINPHFIFNSLNSISMLTLTRPEDAHEMIVKLSTFLRHTIGNAETDMVTLQKEVETIQLYLDIEKSRFGDKLAVTFEGLDEVKDTAKVPNLILQPLIENAIKYGVYESLTQSTILVRVEQLQGVLMVEIINSFEEKPNKAPGKGIGLQNVRRRLQYLYEQPDLLQTKQEETQFSVTLYIPQTTSE